jgi:hypothetical protein
MMPNSFATRALLVLAAALNLLPLAYTGLVIAPGTLAGGDAGARLRFIAAHNLAWSAGWILWMGGSAGLVLSIWALSRAFASRVSAPDLLRLAPLVAVFGGAVDIVGDGIQAATFPVLANHAITLAATDPARSTVLLLFIALDRLAALLSTGAANMLYFIAGALVVLALAQVKGFPRWLTALGALAWLVTLAATPVALVPALAPVAVAGALFLYAAWLVALTVWGIGGGKPRLPLPHFHRV